MAITLKQKAIAFAHHLAERVTGFICHNLSDTWSKRAKSLIRFLDQWDEVQTERVTVRERLDQYELRLLDQCAGMRIAQERVAELKRRGDGTRAELLLVLGRESASMRADLMTVYGSQDVSIAELSERQERRAGQFTRAHTSNRANIADIESRLQANNDAASSAKERLESAKDCVAELKYALLLSEKRHNTRLDDLKQLIRGGDTRLDDLKQLVRAIEQNLRTEI